MSVYNVYTYIHEREWPVIFQSHKVIVRFCYLCYYSIFLKEFVLNKCNKLLYNNILLHINYYYIEIIIYNYKNKCKDIYFLNVWKNSLLKLFRPRISFMGKFVSF